MLMWDGDVITGDHAKRVLASMTILNKEFTKSTGVESDGKNTIWLVAVENQKAVLKRTEQFYRSLRCQVLLDELKPFFRIPKIGTVLLAPGDSRPTLLMRFIGDGTALISVDQDAWLWDAQVIDTLVRICLFDMVVANSSRKGRNILWGGPGVIVPIDEEQAMDFRIQPEFRMNAAVRKRLTMVNLEPYFEEIRPEITEQWFSIASRYYRPDHVEQILGLMRQNVVRLRERFFRYLDTSYGHATRSGIPSRSKLGPQPWEREP